MAIATALPGRLSAPAHVSFMALMLVASASLLGGGALRSLDTLINHRAPTLADGAVETPEELHLRPLSPSAEAAPPFVLPFGAKVQRQRATDCLTEAVYYEAGFQPVQGQEAVAQVVLNRVRDRNFPSTVCGVVYQGARRRTGCQFSFACDGSRRRRPPGRREWDRAQMVAERALDGFVMAEVGTATHYHAATTDPWWRPTVQRIAQVGDHVFYRWPGKAGRVAALDDHRYSGQEPALGGTAPRINQS